MSFEASCLLLLNYVFREIDSFRVCLNLWTQAAAKRKMGSAGDAGDVEFAQLANNASRKTSEFDKVKKQKSDRVGTQGMP